MLWHQRAWYQLLLIIVCLLAMLFYPNFSQHISEFWKKVEHIFECLSLIFEYICIGFDLWPLLKEDTLFREGELFCHSVVDSWPGTKSAALNSGMTMIFNNNIHVTHSNICIICPSCRWFFFPRKLEAPRKTRRGLGKLFEGMGTPLNILGMLRLTPRVQGVYPSFWGESVPGVCEQHILKYKRT